MNSSRLSWVLNPVLFSHHSDRNLQRLFQEKKEGEQTVDLAKIALEKEMQEKKDRLRIARQNRMGLCAH